MYAKRLSEYAGPRSEHLLVFFLVTKLHTYVHAQYLPGVVVIPGNPSLLPTVTPSLRTTSSANPTLAPTQVPAFDPTINPTIDPTINPTINPTIDFRTVIPSLTPVQTAHTPSPTVPPSKTQILLEMNGDSGDHDYHEDTTRGSASSIFIICTSIFLVLLTLVVFGLGYRRLKHRRSEFAQQYYENRLARGLDHVRGSLNGDSESDCEQDAIHVKICSYSNDEIAEI